MAVPFRRDISEPPAPPTTLNWRPLASLAFLWLAGTAALLLFRPGYTFPPFDVVDSWIYTSYQWDFRNQLADFGTPYYESRLSWILPGALLHSILSPIAANLCLKLSVSALFAAACGAVVYRAAGINAARLAVTLSVFAPQIIVALHTDYVDTPVIVYATLTLACITVARHSRHWAVWIFLGGCFFAGMVVANLSSIGVPGLSIALFHLLWLRWGFTRQLICIGLYLLAALLVVAVLGWIHTRIGGAFYFLKPQVAMMLYFHSTKLNPWSAPNWQWLYGATWLVLPIGTLLWGARVCLTEPAGESDSRRLIQALTAALVVSFTWATVLEFKGFGTLLYFYYASYHLCFALPLLAALCWQATGAGKKTWLWAGCLIGALIAFSLVGKPLYAWTSLVPFHRLLRTPESLPWLALAILLLAGLLGASGWLPAVVRRGCRAEFLILGLFICSTSAGFHGREISDRLRERYALVHKTYRLLARELPRGSYIFWVHPEQRDGISLASVKLWGYRMLTDKPFPELGSPRYSDRTVIIPCPPARGAAILAEATRVLTNVGIAVTVPRIIPVAGKAGLGFDLVCFSMLRLVIDPAHPPSGIKPPVMLLDFLAAGDRAYTRQLGRRVHDPAKGEVLDLSAGYPVFYPSAAEDYLATLYHPCPPSPSGQPRQVSIVTEMPALGNCEATIQDQQFHAIAQLSLTARGREIHMVTLPPDVTSVRVLFSNPLSTYTALPTHIQFYEIPE